MLIVPDCITWIVTIFLFYRAIVGDRVSLQGNLDSSAIYAPPETIREEVSKKDHSIIISFVFDITLLDQENVDLIWHSRLRCQFRARLHA